MDRPDFPLGPVSSTGVTVYHGSISFQSYCFHRPTFRYLGCNSTVVLYIRVTL